MALALLLSSSPVMATVVVPEAHWSIYSEGVRQEKLGNQRQAVLQYTNALNIESRDADTLIKLGLMYLHSDSTEADLRAQSLKKAIDYLNKADSVRRGDAMVNMLLGQANQSLGNYQDSIAYYQKAINAEPDNTLIKLDLGVLYYEEHNYKQAIELLSKVVMAYPENLKARGYLGASLQATGNYIAAIEQYNYVASYEQNHFSILKNLGDSWLALEQFDKAKENYSQARTVDPKVPNTYADLAYVAIKEKDYASAVEYYKQALKLKDDDNWRKSLAYSLWANNSLEEAVTKFQELGDYNIVAYLYQVLGNNEQAIVNYKLAIAKDPKDLKSAYNLARLYHDTQQQAKAIDLYSKLLEYKPNDSEVMFLLAVAQQELGANEQAVKSYDEILALNDGIANNNTELRTKTMFNAAVAYRNMNNLTKAEEYFEKVLGTDAKFEKANDVYKELSFIKIALNKNSEAEKIIGDWLKESPTSVEARNLYADYLIHKSKEQQAIEQLRLASALDKTTETRLKLANLLHSQNNLYEALAEYQAILKKEPDNITALLGAANNFRALGLRDEAKDLYKRTLLKYPDDLLANYNYGLILQEEKKVQEALTYYSKVEKINPGFSENYYVMGLCYWDLGNKDAATNAWKKFLLGSGDETLRHEIMKRLNEEKAVAPAATINNNVSRSIISRDKTGRC